MDTVGRFTTLVTLTQEGAGAPPCVIGPHPPPPVVPGVSEVGGSSGTETPETTLCRLLLG